MIKIAIVGNIASGKSEVEKIIEKEGYVVFDTDLITHDILLDNPTVAKSFVDYDVFEYGRLSREKLGKLVFNNSELKHKLESIVHPLILEELEQIFKSYSDERCVFVSVPLLFEVGWEKLFDKIIFVKTDDAIRLGRLMKNRGYSKEYAEKRMSAQLSQDEKTENSDIVIENNGTILELEEQVRTVLKSL